MFCILFCFSSFFKTDLMHSIKKIMYISLIKKNLFVGNRKPFFFLFFSFKLSFEDFYFIVEFCCLIFILFVVFSLIFSSITKESFKLLEICQERIFCRCMVAWTNLGVGNYIFDFTSFTLRIRHQKQSFQPRKIKNYCMLRGEC
jgi:hypothetical protein